MKSKFILYFKNQIHQIASHNSLRYYGAALCVVQFVSIHFMKDSLVSLGDSFYKRYCWPFFRPCNDYTHMWSPWLADVIFVLWISVSVLGFVLFLTNKRINVAYWSLFFVNLLKYLILIQDMRMMGNYHYMPFIITWAFLLLPNKTKILPIFLVMFYYSAGTLKLNYQWLSGHTMVPPPWLSRELFSIACIYVVFLEMIFIWGILFKSRFVRWLVFTQLVVFHVISFYWVGYFYPSVMACLITIFPLVWFLEKDAASRGVLGYFSLKKINYAVLTVYVFCQVVPYFYGGDSALTGKGRTFSLNMYDATTECSGWTYIEEENSTIEVSGWVSRSFAQRVHCDPILYFNDLRMMCKEQEANPKLQAIQFHLFARRITSPQFSILASTRNFCDRPLQNNLIGSNNWIEDEK